MEGLTRRVELLLLLLLYTIQREREREREREVLRGIERGTRERNGEESKEREREEVGKGLE